MVESSHTDDAHALRDLELEEPSLPLDKPEVEAARTLLTPEDLESHGSRDIMEIIQLCLKEMKPLLKQHNTGCAMKMLTQVTSVLEYVRLCVIFKSSNLCRWPCLKASLAIAHRMGKGIYFAHQICYVGAR